MCSTRKKGLELPGEGFSKTKNIKIYYFKICIKFKWNFQRGKGPGKKIP